MLSDTGRPIRAVLLQPAPAPFGWAAAVIALAPAPAPPGIKNAIQRGLILARWRGGEVVGGPPTLRMVERTLEEGGRAAFAFDNARVARRTRDALRGAGVTFDESPNEKA